MAMRRCQLQSITAVTRRQTVTVSKLQYIHARGAIMMSNDTGRHVSSHVDREVVVTDTGKNIPIATSIMRIAACEYTAVGYLQLSGTHLTTVHGRDNGVTLVRLLSSPCSLRWYHIRNDAGDTDYSL